MKWMQRIGSVFTAALVAATLVTIGGGGADAVHVGSGAEYADAVVSTNTSGSLERPPHDGADNALGAPDGTNSSGWFNLGDDTGSDGEIVVGFGDAVAVDGPGSDLRIWEAHSYGADGVDEAEVFVSQDGVTYHSVGTATDDPEPLNNASYANDFDFALVPVDFVRFVKLQNTGTPTDDQGANGFDLDSVEALNPADAWFRGGGNITSPDDATPTDQARISFGGDLFRAPGGELFGDWSVRFHDVDNDDLDRTTFEATSFEELTYFTPEPGKPADGIARFTAVGELDGEPGYGVCIRGEDAGEPGAADNIRIELFEGTPSCTSSSHRIYDSTLSGDFPGESDNVGTARHLLDAGNLEIAELE